MRKANLILNKTNNFALKITKFNHYIRSEQKEYELSKQLLRRRNSIGANAEKVNNAQFNKDFI
ncbi:MAG: four helix bundle protein [Bacteroidales bacterium]|nr:four helix bundle protein [Bacteroidales bacterium]